MPDKDKLTKAQERVLYEYYKGVRVPLGRVAIVRERLIKMGLLETHYAKGCTGREYVSGYVLTAKGLDAIGASNDIITERVNLEIDRKMDLEKAKEAGKAMAAQRETERKARIIMRVCTEFPFLLNQTDFSIMQIVERIVEIHEAG